MDYSMEDFISWCDDMTIADEGLKKITENTVNDIKKYFNPTDLDTSEVRKVSSLSGLRNALYEKTPVIRPVGKLKDALTQEVIIRKISNAGSTGIGLGAILFAPGVVKILFATGKLAFDTMGRDPAWKNASFYKVVKSKRGSVFIVYGNYIKKKDSEYNHK